MNCIVLSAFVGGLLAEICCIILSNLSAPPHKQHDQLHYILRAQVFFRPHCTSHKKPRRDRLTRSVLLYVGRLKLYVRRQLSIYNHGQVLRAIGG
jgi:hypothetical protein